VLRLLKTLPHPFKKVLPGNTKEPLRSKRIQAHIDPANTTVFDVSGKTFEQHPIGSQCDFLQSFYLRKPFKKTYEPLSYQGFPASESDFANSFLNREPDDMEHFFIGEDFTVGHESNALFRHTIDTSQIAAVSDRKSQVIDASVIVIQQWEVSEGF
jgi:hypothetical protein